MTRQEIHYNDDIYIDFLENCTEKSDKHVSTVQLYTGFKKWLIMIYPNIKIIPNNRVFNANIRKHRMIEKVRVREHSNVTTGIKNLKLTI